MKHTNSNLSAQLELYFALSIEKLTENIEAEITTVIEEFYIEKRNSEKRKIHEVKRKSILWSTQKFLNKNTFSEMKFPDYVFGFKKDKSYFGFLQHHVDRKNKKVFLKLDLKDFFYSINVQKLVENIINEFEHKLDKRESLEKLLYLVLTYNGKLPQGFQTSPILSNFYFLRADLRIKKYCDKLGITYSRYADDIILSSALENEEKLSNRTISMVECIINDFDLNLNRKKIKTSKVQLVLNGFVVSTDVRLSQTKLKELRRVLFTIEHSSRKSDKKEILKKINSDKKINYTNRKRNFSHEYLLNYLSGNRSFLISSIKESNKSNDWYKNANNLIQRIEHAILRMY